ncbi:MAG: TRAP transporter substrate-binding protein DctP [Ectothiorhodospiraceae bacterium]|nr:TRAP transporter substrate-binding protein DctP [Chromatiales bacterium]MCP5153339.1 TRAP transporter substrate-binding protein DctP [Ectothiorhodospiraceae bacterium]
MDRSSRLRAALAAATLTIGFAMGASAEDAWKMPTASPAGGALADNVAKYVQDVQAFSGGKVRVALAPPGASAQTLAGLARGQVPIAEIELAASAGEHPLLGIDGLPFLVSGYVKAEKLWRVSRPAVERIVASGGYRILFAVPAPPEGLFSRQPVPVPSALRGRRLGVADAAGERLAALLGATAVRIGPGDLTRAFADGAVDAALASPPAVISAALARAAPHFYRIEARMPKRAVVVSSRALAGLERGAQMALVESAKRAEQRGWRASREQAAAVVEALTAAGVNVHEPEPQFIREMHDLARRLVLELTERGGEEAIAIVDAYFRPE